MIKSSSVTGDMKVVLFDDLLKVAELTGQLIF